MILPKNVRKKQVIKISKKKKLADWIKAEETQGYTEEQLVKSLLKKRYLQKDIDRAVLYLKHKFHLKALLHIPWYLIVTFFISVMFLGWAFGELIDSLKILGILVGSVLLVNWLGKHNLDFASWLSLGFMYFLFSFISPLFFLVAAGTLIISIGIFYSNRRRINFYLFNIALMISVFITALVCFLIFLLITFLVLPYLPSMSVVYLAMLYLPIIYIIPPLIYLFNHLALSKIKAAPTNRGVTVSKAFNPNKLKVASGGNKS